MQAAALIVIYAFALWLAAAGVAGLLRPAMARGWIGRFATSHRINLAEQAWRGLAGAALIVRAPLSASPSVFAAAGWVLVVSAVLLVVVPLRWHGAYAQWWSHNLPLPAVRVAGLLAIIAAVGLASSV